MYTLQKQLNVSWFSLVVDDDDDDDVGDNVTVDWQQQHKRDIEWKSFLKCISKIFQFPLYITVRLLCCFHGIY